MNSYKTESLKSKLTQHTTDQ